VFKSAHIRFLLVAASLAFSAGALAYDITIRADSRMPYRGPQNGQSAGYMIDLARKIASANGHTIDYANMPMKDALYSVRKGEFDCVAGIAREDAADFNFSNMSWGKSQNAFYAMADSSWRYNGLQSLEAVRLAVIDGYSYSPELDAYIAAHRKDGSVVVVNNIRRPAISAVSQIATKKADVFIEDFMLMRQTLQTMQMADRVVKVGVLDTPSDVYLACTPANWRGKEFAKLFSDGLAKLRDSGELQPILDQYAIKDWEGPGGLALQ
jgi:polar amino acid transport system substrate-binding protein